MQDDIEHDGRVLPRNAIVQYREWYGMQPGKPNVGLKLTAQEVAAGIVRRETNPETGKREHVSFGVMDPAAFAVISGPSIAETMIRQGVTFRRADNTRRSTDKRAGGWDQLRHRLKGDDEGRPLIYFFDTCRDSSARFRSCSTTTTSPRISIPTLRITRSIKPATPVWRDPIDPGSLTKETRNPWLVANAFRLHELRD